MIAESILYKKPDLNKLIHSQPNFYLTKTKFLSRLKHGERKNDDVHQEFYELIQKFLSEKEMTFVKKHIDTIELEKIKIKDRTESNYMDLMKFTVDMLVNYYKCHNADAIMCTIIGQAPAYWCNTLPQNKPVKKNLLQINEFRSLLTAGDSSTMKTLQAVS